MIKGKKSKHINTRKLKLFRLKNYIMKSKQKRFMNTIQVNIHLNYRIFLGGFLNKQTNASKCVVCMIYVLKYWKTHTKKKTSHAVKNVHLYEWNKTAENKMRKTDQEQDTKQTHRNSWLHCHTKENKKKIHK